MPKIKELTENFSDIQGNVIRGYGPKYASYCFYHIHPDATEDGKAWLQAILDEKPESEFEDLRVTTSQRWIKKNNLIQKPPFTLNIAITHRGLQALGLPDHVLATFPEEFRQGMRERAVTELGDEPKSKKEDATEEERKTPKKWEKAFLTNDIHILVIITAQNLEQRNRGVNCLNKLTARFPKVELLNIHLEGAALKEPRKGQEHFGYQDGISQPFIEGTDHLFKDKDPRPPHRGQGTPTENGGKWLSLKPGEFILGYEDEFGEVAQAPMHYGLRKNGTYLVLRKLSQDVPAFREFLATSAKKIWNKNDPQHKDLLAAKLMGRWKSGCPLVLQPKKDNQHLAKDPGKNNDFGYIHDKEGLSCPLGAHIRLTNPRDQLLPAPRDIYSESPETYYLNRHRIIRRGLPYGSPLPEGKVDTKQRGLIFLALNASIARQFEFVQKQWVNNGEGFGMDPNDRDPFIGSKDDGKAQFTVPGAHNPFVQNLQRFVTERGGEYFFYPGRNALEGIAKGRSVATQRSCPNMRPSTPCLRGSKEREQSKNWSGSG